MRWWVEKLLQFILRVFFRRADVVGGTFVPPMGPVIFVVNHPNALIDPLCVFCLAPRRVAFLAKSTLFSMPGVGLLVRWMECIPVYRRQDAGVDPRQNVETFVAARNLLQSGGTLAVVPEGVSHSDPHLRPLKSGTARIALGAAAMRPTDAQALQVIPAGLFYTAKGKLRGSVMLQFGAPVPVPQVTLDARQEPPPDVVQTLTEDIRAALSHLTIQHETTETLPLLIRAAMVLDDGSGDHPLLHSLQLQQRLAHGWTTLRARHPADLEAVVAQVRTYDAALQAAGLPAEAHGDLVAAPVPDAQAPLWALIAMAPLASVGAMLHAPAYKLIGRIAAGSARREDDMLATIKVLAALIFLPLTWAAAGLVLARVGLGLLAIALPLTGWAALVVLEAYETRVLMRRYRAVAPALAEQRAQIKEGLGRLAVHLEETR